MSAACLPVIRARQRLSCQRRRPARPAPEPSWDIDVAASAFACLSCFGFRISRLPFLLAIHLSPSSKARRGSDRRPGRSCDIIMLMESLAWRTLLARPGLAACLGALPERQWV